MIGLIRWVPCLLAQVAPAGLTTTDTVFKWFWTTIVFASIAWYTVLLFWLGIKGGYEIVRMIRVLSQQRDERTE